MTYAELKKLDEKATQGMIDVIDGSSYNFAVQAIVGKGNDPLAEFFLRADADLAVALVNWFRTEGQRVFEDAEKWRDREYPEQCARRVIEGFHKGLDGDALLEFARAARKEQGHG